MRKKCKKLRPAGTRLTKLTVSVRGCVHQFVCTLRTVLWKLSRTDGRSDGRTSLLADVYGGLARHPIEKTKQGTESEKLSLVCAGGGKVGVDGWAHRKRTTTTTLNGTTPAKGIQNGRLYIDHERWDQQDHRGCFFAIFCFYCCCPFALKPPCRL